MTSAIRLQGTIFCSLAAIVTVLSLILPRLEERIELITIASLIILLGVPHGAMDTIFAKSIYKISSIKGWLVFSGIYILIASLVVGVWVLTPILFLLGFLVISIAHFSGDPVDGTRTLSRLLYGGAVIVLPTLFNQLEIERLFGFLVGSSAALSVSAIIAWLSWPWLLGLLLAALFEFTKNKQTGFELLAVAALATFAPPLVGFTLFFCIMHSARHILRTLNYAKGTSTILILMMSILPMLTICIAIAIGWNALVDVSFDVLVIQIIFVGLAALTVPHMALVERVRLTC